MGKEKKGQRTKGNVRPSSSSRAAEELVASGGAGGFIGFGALSGDLGYVPASPGLVGDDDSGADADFRLVLRKVSKRDVTTKLKALQEFTTLCKEKDLEDVKSVLPYWPRIYSKASIDFDRRVREACQQAFEQLVVRVRRDLAPHLKSLMGPWIISQCDVYAPAASAAKLAFQSAFPPAKQTEALLYCKLEVLQHLSDNMFKHTPQTLSDPKTSEPEDMKAKYLRLMTTSVLALRLFITLIPREQQAMLLEEYRYFLKESKFWKLFKHTHNQIRAACYLSIATICQVHPSLANEFADKICPCVLHNLDDTDPIVGPAVWEAALYTVSVIDGCWDKVNARKGVLPKLWSVFKNGGNGCATVIYPNMLPLLGKIPEDIVGEGTGFYEAWFGNLKLGLSLDKVLSSPSECNAVVKCFIECLQYCLHRSITKKDTGLLEYLIHEQLFPVLEASWTDRSAALANSVLYFVSADLLRSVHKLSSADIPEAARVEGMLWSGLTKLCLNHVQSDSSSDYVLERIGWFVCAFMKPAASHKTPAKVRFAEEADDADTKPEKADFCAPSIQESVKSTGVHLHALVCKMCGVSLEKSRVTCGASIGHLALVNELFNYYVSDELIGNLLGHLVCEAPDSSAPPPFVGDFILPLIRNAEEREQTEDTTSSAITLLVNITVSTSRLLSFDQKVSTLSKVLRTNSLSTLHLLIVTFTRHGDPDVVSWLKGNEFGGKMVGVTEDLCDHSLGRGTPRHCDADTSWALLAMTLATDQHFEPVIGSKYMEKILVVMKTALPTPSCVKDNDRSHACISFVCRVAGMFFANIKGCLMIKSSEELLLAITQLICHPMIHLTEEIIGNVLETCKLGVNALLYQKGGFLDEEGFFLKITSHIKFQVINTGDSIERLAVLGRVSEHICSCMATHFATQDENGYSNAVTQGFVKQLTMPFMHSMLPEWADATIVSNKMLLSSIPQSPFTTTSALPKCLGPVVFTSALLSAITAQCSEFGGGAYPTDLETALDMLYGVTFCEAVMYGCTQDINSEMSKASKILDTNINSMLMNMERRDIHLLCDKLFHKSLCEGQLWSLTLGTLATKLKQQMVSVNWLQVAGGMDRFTILVEPSVNTLQALLPFMSKPEVTQIAEVQTAQIMTCERENITRVSGGTAYMCVLNCALALQEHPLGDDLDALNPEVFLSVLAELQLWREQNEDLFIFDTGVRTLDWSVIGFNVQVLQFMSLAVEKLPAKLKDSHWDFIMCSLVSWVQSCQEAAADLSVHLPTKSFCCHVFSLVASIAKCMLVVLPQHSDGFPPNLATEWNEFFSESAYSVLLPMFVDRATRSDEVGAGMELVMKALCRAVCHTPAEHVKSHRLPARLVAGEENYLPDDLQTLLNHLCPLLVNRRRAVQLASYRLLIKIMPELSKYDEGKAGVDGSGEDSRALPPGLVTTLKECTEIVSLALGELPMGETCSLEPQSDAHTHSVAYLLTWKLILAFFKGASSEMRAQYAFYLRENKAVDVLMLNLFRLMPEHPIIPLKDVLSSQNAAQKLTDSRNLFSEEPMLDIQSWSSSVELGHLACSVYLWTLQDLPAIIRQWWNDQDKQTAGIVETFTMKYVTPILSLKELTIISKHDVPSENMTIKARPATREVVATYTVEEVSMELVVALAVNHPLGSIAVESGRRVGVATQEWRNWMLQLTTYLNHQNGTILDGLSLWKRNVDKKFEGIEECFICFSVINATNCQLPKPQCRTCKKRFHSACLYKWFNTSNKSTCPLCRNLF